jgi:hypothetical protein
VGDAVLSEAFWAGRRWHVQQEDDPSVEEHRVVIRAGSIDGTVNLRTSAGEGPTGRDRRDDNPRRGLRTRAKHRLGTVAAWLDRWLSRGRMR